MKTQAEAGKTVLVVEDAEAIAVLINHILAHAGYRHEYARNGQDALDMLQQGLRPDLILLDIVMPVMNGYEFLEHLGKDESLGKIPVVMLTALDDAADVLKSMKKGALDYCTKPIEPDDLLATMNRVWSMQNLDR